MIYLAGSLVWNTSRDINITVKRRDYSLSMIISIKRWISFEGRYIVRLYRLHVALVSFLFSFFSPSSRHHRQTRQSERLFSQHEIENFSFTLDLAQSC